jgi:hypothetical protein
MTSKIILSLFSLIAIYSSFSCTKEGTQGPPGPPGDTGMYVPLKGDIKGKVIVYDSLGIALADYSGVEVIIDSTDLKDTTDASGAYSFSDVPAGRYNFSYRKEGFGTYRIIRQLHPGGPQPTQLKDADVGQIYNGPPVTYFDYFGLGSPNNPDIVVYVEFASEMRLPTAAVLYISNTPDLSATNFKTNIRYNRGFYESSNAFQTSPIDPNVIRADTTLLFAPDLYFYLAFDNVRRIYYIDEQGRIVYPCTGTRLGSFRLYGQLFARNPFSSTRTNSGIYPPLLKFRLK